jgi:O-antigen ligase
MITASVVARPLVLGEDPGLLINRLSDASGLTLGLVWLALAAAWAMWRIWSREPGPRLLIVEIGLFILAALAFASARWAASYKHPAWLVAWEWLIGVIVFALVRRFAVRGTDCRNLIAAFVATAVCVSVYGIYQYAVEIPALQNQLRSDPDRLRQELARQGIEFPTGDARYEHLVDRIEMKHAYGTFAHPNSFASYLALAFPVAVCGALTARRLGKRQTLAAVIAALVIGAALFLTHSRGATLGLLLAGAILLICRLGGLLSRKAVVSLVLFLALCSAAGAGESSGLRRARTSLALRLGYWNATWKMISDPHHVERLWLGVGPGNFSRFYPQYMAAKDWEKVSDPHNCLLEIWATCGLPALGAFILALIAYFWTTRILWRQSIGDDRKPASHGLTFGDWEFYFGGMAGLILGFMLWATNRPTEEYIVGGVAAAIRALVWFLTFTALKRISWEGPLCRLGATLGITSSLFNMMVSGGVSFPSVAQPFWTMAALSLPPSETGLRTRMDETRRRLHLLPAAGLSVLFVVYCLWIFLPVTRANTYLKRAQTGAYAWQTETEPTLRRARTSKTQEAYRTLLQADNYLQTHVIAPLDEATRLDPTDAGPWVELANWFMERWRLFPQSDCDKRASRAAGQAIELDPWGKEGYLARYRIDMVLASASKTDQSSYYGFAATNLKMVVERDPTEARWRYWLAEVLFKADKSAEARVQADRALELDQLSIDPSRRLTVTERAQVQQWVLKRSKS